MSEVELTKDESVPFYPDHVRTEFKVTVGIILIVMAIGFIGLLIPVGLGAPADPLNTPEHVKPEWYFLSLYQLLKFIPKTSGAVAPVLAIIVLTLWPLVDRRPVRSPRV